MKEGVRDEYKLLVEFMEKVEKYYHGDKEEVDKESLLVDLEEVQDVVAQIDMGNVFIKLGGGRAMLKIANDAEFSTQLRSEALRCISMAVQNNPPSQEEMIGCGAVEEILLLTKKDMAEDVRVAAMGAVGSISRGSLNGEKRLTSPESALVFREAVLTGCPRLCQKTVFLLKAIAMAAQETQNSELLFYLREVIEPVVSSITSESSDLVIREHAIGFVTAFVTADPSVLDIVVGLRDMLKNTRTQRINMLRCSSSSINSYNEQENDRTEMGLWMQLNAACCGDREGHQHDESSNQSSYSVSCLSDSHSSNNPLLVLAKQEETTNLPPAQ